LTVAEQFRKLALAMRAEFDSPASSDAPRPFAILAPIAAFPQAPALA
jgi:hypothetical protein